MSGLSDGSQQSSLEEYKNESKDESSEESRESKKDLRDKENFSELVTGFKSIGLSLPEQSGVPRNVDSTLKDLLVTPSYLKECITNLDLKAKVKPIALSFSGLPDSGKTAAVNCVRGKVKESVFRQVRSALKQPKAEGIAFYEMVAASLSVLKEPIINEFTTESCFAPVILSAFKKKLLSKGKLPRFHDPSEVLCSDVYEFKQPDLDEHLCFIYQFLSQQAFIVKNLEHSDTDSSNKSKAQSQFLIESLPEGIALINIWDVAFDEYICDFLAALQGHLYNHHMWLFLDLNQDSRNLEKPPKINKKGSKQNITMLVQWRPHLHYLLRLCKMSEDKEGIRRKVCTI